MPRKLHLEMVKILGKKITSVSHNCTGKFQLYTWIKSDCTSLQKMHGSLGQQLGMKTSHLNVCILLSSRKRYSLGNKYSASRWDWVEPTVCPIDVRKQERSTWKRVREALAGVWRGRVDAWRMVLSRDPGSEQEFGKEQREARVRMRKQVGLRGWKGSWLGWSRRERAEGQEMRPKGRRRADHGMALEMTWSILDLSCPKTKWGVRIVAQW